MGRIKERIGILMLAIAILVVGGAFTVEAATITLNPSSSTVGLNETFNVDLVLNLDTAVNDLDGVGIYLKYDPNILNVLDYDAGNWDTTGTNILDGPYHVPFNLPGDIYFPNRNVVGPEGGISDGEISWFVSSGFYGSGVSVPAGSNVFATIQFQAAGVLGSTNLTFSGTNSGGFNDTWVHSTASGYLLPTYEKSFVGGEVTVIPEPGTLILLGSGILGLITMRKRRVNQ
ncbi:MAG: PEP-CTERM sorting domain-containing protein [Nitrospirae bacterium]|nr:PEP-CTERM sorting domain-containing protein [Nitrospirota bacterium]